ncbi:MAG: universal stress protein [Rhodothermaceae bacterium]
MNLIRKILIPVDFSAYSRNALNYAFSFSQEIEAEIYTIYVVEPLIFPADFSMGQISIPAMDVDTTERAKNELSTFIDNVLGQNNQVKTVIKTGKPFVEINETAAELDIDLIIIASHGHTGVEHLFFGGTAEKVVRKAPCPVLTLREPIKGFKYKG